MNFDAATILKALGILLFLLVSVVMILTILIQRPQGGGLSGAFGSGAGAGQTAFGTKTGDALTIATIGMFVLFVVLAMGLNFAVRPPSLAPAPPTATQAAPTPPTPTVPTTNPENEAMAPAGNEQPAPATGEADAPQPPASDADAAPAGGGDGAP